MNALSIGWMAAPSDPETPWQRFRRCLCKVPSVDLTLDVSNTRLDEESAQRLGLAMQRAFDAMEALEKGAIANPDEGRMVGHYWLRAPGMAPTPELAEQIGPAGGHAPN